MIYAFTGFSQEGTYRVFSFELLPRSPGRGAFQVRADIADARRYRIPLQELPILCRGVLENRHETDTSHQATYSAADMLAHANARETAEENRKARRRFVPRRTTAVGAGQETDAAESGGRAGTRTPDLLRVKQAL